MFFSKKITPELISLHIPKTAGTSFRNILKSVYGEEQVVRLDINGKEDVRLNQILYRETQLPKAKVIHGHFTMELIENKFKLPPDVKVITWLRDPVKRVVSNYFYLESRLKEILDEENNNLNILSKMQRTLIEYARSENSRNRQTKFVKGRSLEDFDFVGIQEHFESDIGRLSKVLGWKELPNILYHNKTPELKADISNEILDEIYELNKEDTELYNKAIELRNKLMND
ncbi:MAG TPA: sulfotransferase family 2 domain-containing protein [Bacteroidia bacterium]|nr:sulfotransferase family 2 domain-containing protein [Bacteroidia bacterium]